MVTHMRGQLRVAQICSLAGVWGCKVRVTLAVVGTGAAADHAEALPAAPKMSPCTKLWVLLSPLHMLVWLAVG